MRQSVGDIACMWRNASPVLRTSARLRGCGVTVSGLGLRGQRLGICGPLGDRGGAVLLRELMISVADVFSVEGAGAFYVAGAFDDGAAVGKYCELVAFDMELEQELIVCDLA